MQVVGTCDTSATKPTSQDVISKKKKKMTEHLGYLKKVDTTYLYVGVVLARI
jgi:hypothetical protein